MATATFAKFNSFTTAVAAGTHAGCLNADTDVLEVYLTNATPSASADSLKADLAEITIENGYAGGVDIENAATQTGAVITLTAADKTITASGGTVGPFRYAVIFNETATDDPLIGYYDYGEAITLGDGESFVIDFGAALLTWG